MAMRRPNVVATGAATFAMAAYLLTGYGRAVSLVVHAAGAAGWPARMAGLQNRPSRESDLTVPSRHGLLRARLYRPAGLDGAIVLVHGVHAAGIDEPRLVGFARHLAAAGIAVLTPELVDLKRYAVTTRSTDMIEDAGLWILTRHDLARDGRVGLMGISFGGGLSIVAAGRAALRQSVAFVFSFGGHGDLPRVLRYLCTGRLPDGTPFPPHDYGVALTLLGVAREIVPSDQLPGLEHAILTFLEASRLDMVDRSRALEEFERANALERTLPEPSASYLRLVNRRDVAALGPKLLPYIDRVGTEAGPRQNGRRHPQRPSICSTDRTTT
jgi:hypothetical protein